MKFTKRIVALLICALMIVTALPVGIFAEDATATETAEEATKPVDFKIDLDFEDAISGGYTDAADHLAANIPAGTDFVYGLSGTSAAWGNYATDENGNVYIAHDSIDNGYWIMSNSGLLSDRILKISFDYRTHFLTTSYTTSGTVCSILRVTNNSGSTGGGNATTDLLSLKPAAAVGATRTEDEKLGDFGYNTSTGASYVGLGYECKPNTWYNIELIVNTSTNEGVVTITDGETSMTGKINSANLVGVKGIGFSRGYTSYGLASDLDNVCITSYPSDIIDASWDFEGLAEGTLAADPDSALGYTLSGAKDKWSVAKDGDNSYIAHNGSAAPLNWAVNNNIGTAMTQNPFEISFSFKVNDGTQTQCGLLSVHTAVGEKRIVNLNNKDGALFFGPSANAEFKIADVTKGVWHDFKAVMIPSGTEYLYRFYVDGELAAYTEIVDGSYNFYQRTAAGIVLAVEDIESGYYSTVPRRWTWKETGEDGKEVTKTEAYVEGEDTPPVEGATLENYGWMVKSAWGTSTDNNGRNPVGLWDGYYKIDTKNLEENSVLTPTETKDGVLDPITQVTLYYYNQGDLALDDFKVAAADLIENVELYGVQYGKDGHSVRFVLGVESFNFSKVGVKVERILGDKGWEAGDEMLTRTNVVLTSILEDGKLVSAAEYGATALTTLAIYDIESAGEIRLTPYTMQDGIPTYGESITYAVDIVDEKVKLTVPTEVYVQPFDTFNPGGGEGYGRGTWEAQCNPNADIGWGGEGLRTMVLEDGTVKWVGGASKGYRKASNAAQRTTDVNQALKTEDGTPIPWWTYSERVKFARVIPTNMFDYLGQTLVISMKIRVDEIAKSAQNQEKPLVVGDKTYYEYEETVFTDPETTVPVAIGFFDDRDTAPVAGSTPSVYSLKADGEWVEISAKLDVTYEMLGTLMTVADANGELHPSVVRPTLYGGSLTKYIKTAYIDDVTCTVIPLVHECTEYTLAEALEPTCAADGYTRNVCAVCGEVDETSVVVKPATGVHTPDKDAPTCGDDQICTVCGAVLATATGDHTPDREAATCVLDKTCTVCGDVLEAATGSHTPDKESPTCDEGVNCVVCGEEMKPAGHPGVEYVYPTISTDGYIRGTCTACGESFNEFLERGLTEDFENMDEFTTDEWNTNSAFAVDEIEVSVGSANQHKLVTEGEGENENTYWVKDGSSSGAIWFIDASEKNIMTDSILEVSFKYQLLSGTGNCSIFGMKVGGDKGTTGGTETRIINNWGGKLHSGTNSGTDLTGKVAGNGEWYDIRIVVDTRTYDHKVWLNNELVVMTDYANTLIYCKGSDGTWISRNPKDDSDKNPINNNLDSDFTSIYMFHYTNSVKFALDDLRIAILDSMPTDTLPEDAFPAE